MISRAKVPAEVEGWVEVRLRACPAPGHDWVQRLAAHSARQVLSLPASARSEDGRHQLLQAVRRKTGGRAVAPLLRVHRGTNMLDGLGAIGLVQGASLLPYGPLPILPPRNGLMRLVRDAGTPGLG